MGKLSKLSRNKRTEAKKQKIARQPGRTKENKLRKMLKHLRRNPDDKQTKAKVEV